jgi:hypothetical protein
MSFIYSLEDLRLPRHIDLRLYAKNIRGRVMKGEIIRASRLKVDDFLRKDFKRIRCIERTRHQYQHYQDPNIQGLNRSTHPAQNFLVPARVMNLLS